MKQLFLVAALTLISGQSNADAQQCNTYTARHDADLRLVETKDDFTVSWENFSETYKKTYMKSFGVIMDAGYKGVGPDNETHLFMHDKLDGIDVIILDSIVMLPSCGKRSGSSRKN
jgi:hypothetical protein